MFAYANKVIGVGRRAVIAFMHLCCIHSRINLGECAHLDPAHRQLLVHEAVVALHAVTVVEEA
jgi:hypothetical protein